MCWLCAAAVLVASAGCGVPDQSRWERGEVSTNTVEPTDDDGTSDTSAFVVVEVGPVVAAIEARGDVLVVDPTVVLAERTGRLESRSTAAGDDIAVGAVVLEFSDAADPTDELRIDILEIERDIAELDGRSDEVDRLDTEIVEAISNARNDTSTNLATVVAPSAGVISEYFVSVFDVVRPGDALFSLGDPGRRAVVLALPAEMIGDVEAPEVGSGVSLVDPRSALGDPIAATITAIEPAADTANDVDDQGEQVVTIALDPSSPFAVGDDVIVVFESTSASESLRLAADAVRGAGDTGYVIVETSGGEWRRVDIRIGARTDRFVQIAESAPLLVEGDRVVLP